jgi:MtN3 and saliva related transmembrane protein
MNDSGWHWLGSLAASLTTLAFVPQAWLTLRTRQVEGISTPTYAAFSVGIALWLSYGVALGDGALVIANAITLPLALSILVTKLRVERARRRRPPAPPLGQ